jgi:hypothetical protein
MQGTADSQKAARREYDVCLKFINAIEGERSVVKAAHSLLALGRSCDPLRYSARHMHSLADAQARTYDENLDLKLEVTVLGPGGEMLCSVFFMDDFSRACMFGWCCLLRLVLVCFLSS